jgi:hypothetical protein
MDTLKQHRTNAAKEKRWMDDAKRDQRELTAEGHRLIGRGLKIEGEFDLQEANNAASWLTRRKKVVEREERLGGERHG